MGFSGTFVYARGEWYPVGGLTPLTEIREPPPWLHLAVHDSDMGALTYEPPGPGEGIALLGITYHDYVDEQAPSDSPDVEREADGLAHWWSVNRGGCTEEERLRKREAILPLLARDKPDLGHLSQQERLARVDERLDPEEAAVELCKVLEIPPPSALAPSPW